MKLSPEQKLIIEQVVNAFETGRKEGNYAALALMRDGPKKSKQITYGRSQVTEFGRLRELLQSYIDKGGFYTNDFGPYLAKIGIRPLVTDIKFRTLLKDAGTNDSIMHQTQDEFFDEKYFKPAMEWAEEHGFKLPLSGLVIYDSFIQSGSILNFLRNRFPEPVPSNGGSEKEWISQYVGARHNWLATHSDALLRNTSYRTECFRDQIRRYNWDLALGGLIAHGVRII